MKDPANKEVLKKAGWLLFFYSVPTKPVAGRIRVWRRLTKAGAVQLKGAVYVLPYSEGSFELFQWLASEVVSMKGDAAFVKTGTIETMKDSEVIALFNQQKEEAYRVIEKRLEEIQRRTNAVRNASGTLKDKGISGLLEKCSREFEEIRKTDFFSSKAGSDMQKRVKAIASDVAELTGNAVEKEVRIASKSMEPYVGKTWVTRKNPFIDRMASAWLIKRFVDKDAVFGFVDEADIEGLGDNVITYDVRGGEFTHVGDLCTFEVMVKSFGLKDRTLKMLAGLVHELDVKDDKYVNPEARGVEEILSGIRKTARDDAAALEKGMAVFEMLYASKR